MATPRVSIVTATYNRADVLRFTIQSVLASTFADWEMIIVGDACTDRTEEMVRGFADPRISFINLPTNAGEQSTPNNVGARTARGTHLAFLNHDDLWTPDHLEQAMAHLEGREPGFVSTLTIAIPASGEPALVGALAEEYAPHFVAPASSWVMTRSFFEAVGPWRTARELYLAPSQEWLFRAWKQKRRLPSLHRPTVLAVYSGDRAGSYRVGSSREHEEWARRLRDDPALMLSLVTRIAARRQEQAERPVVLPHVARAAKNMVRRAIFSLGGHPVALQHAVRYRGRGGFIDSLRHTRGLPPLER